MKVTAIWAQGTNGVIGHNGGIPWHVPQDLKFFKEMTLGHAVIMGRKTWDSIPGQFRPLSSRVNIVLSKQRDFVAPGALVVRTNIEALNVARHASKVFIIGGAEIYAAFMQFTDELIVTEVKYDGPGDAHAPKLNPDQWLAYRESYWCESAPVSGVGSVQYRHVFYRNIFSSKL